MILTPFELILFIVPIVLILSIHGYESVSKEPNERKKGSLLTAVQLYTFLLFTLDLLGIIINHMN